MTATIRHEDGGPCPSQFQLDRLSADELSDVERARLDRHLAGCTACTRELAQRAIERAEFVPDPRLVSRLTACAPAAPARLVRRRRVAVAASAMLCAASILWMVQSSPQGPALGRRSTLKGGFSARLVVQRAGELIAIDPAGGPTEGSLPRVHPGDRLQVAISLPGDRFVAVYSRDGAGAISRYAPVDAPMVAMAPGGDQILPNSTILDDVLGHETIAVFACTQDLRDAALRLHVVTGAIPGCDVARIALRKVAP